jgi:hypothetical protein
VTGFEQIRAEVEAETTVLWCLHLVGEPAAPCSRIASRTAVGVREIERLMGELRQLILQRREPYTPSRALRKVALYATPDVLATFPGELSELLALGEPVGVTLFTPGVAL